MVLELIQAFGGVIVAVLCVGLVKVAAYVLEHVPEWEEWEVLDEQD